MRPYIRAMGGQVGPLFRLGENHLSTLLTKTAFFDAPLHHNFHRAAKEGTKFDLRTIMDESLVKIRPGDAVTFVDNHECVADSFVRLNICS